MSVTGCLIYRNTVRKVKANKRRHCALQWHKIAVISNDKQLTIYIYYLSQFSTQEIDYITIHNLSLDYLQIYSQQLLHLVFFESWHTAISPQASKVHDPASEGRKITFQIYRYDATVSRCTLSILLYLVV
jgi:hypothetical protein